MIHLQVLIGRRFLAGALILNFSIIQGRFAGLFRILRGHEILFYLFFNVANSTITRYRLTVVAQLIKNINYTTIGKRKHRCSFSIANR